METIILIVLGLAAWHFVCEGIVAPTLRMILRFDLFAARDRLRRIKIQEGDSFNDEAFGILNESLNTCIQNIGSFTLSLIAKANHDFDSNPELRAKVESRQALISQCSEEVQQLMSQTTRLYIRAIIINSFGWAPYIVPVILTIWLWKNLKALTKAIVVIPEEGQHLSRQFA